MHYRIHEIENNIVQFLDFQFNINISKNRKDYFVFYDKK